MKRPCLGCEKRFPACQDVCTEIKKKDEETRRKELMEKETRYAVWKLNEKRKKTRKR